MSEAKMNHNWETDTLINLAEYYNGAAFKPQDWGEEGLPIIRIEQLNKFDSETDYFSGVLLPKNHINDGDLIFSWSATLKVVIWNRGEGALNQHLYKVVPKQKIDILLLLHILDFNLEKLAGLSQGSTMKHVTRKELSSFHVTFPSNKLEQQKIATILQTIDLTIEKTEALIAKYQKIKAGLMHDLFTRGITADGKLRPPREQVPELYQETAIGWIPKDWEVELIDTIKSFITDGPFGSNLKTEHYTVDAGVQVVRLQNIQATIYNGKDKAFISNQHANTLLRNKVIGEDVLIAGLGDEHYPVGRACLYPANIESAINKADCFILRCEKNKMKNSFMMFFLNTSMAKNQIRKYEQGVTRQRINTGNFKRVIVVRPSLKEQAVIVTRLKNIQQTVKNENAVLVKLKKQKQGLMQDLLTGKVPVKVDQPEAENA